MATRAQMMMIARRQQQQQQAREEARTAMLSQLLSGEIPATTILDSGVFTAQESQNIWNQLAANQWQQRNSTGSGEVFSGTSNQLTSSLNMLTRSPEWQTLDDKQRLQVIQAKFGNEVAQRYQSGLLDREAIAKERRQDIASTFDTERMIQRDKRQAQARLAGTEPEMLQRSLMNRDIIVGADGVLERNPQYNPNDITKQNVPQYVPASPDTERIVASHWDSVRPGRPMPLTPEKQMRIQVADENPNLSAEDIVKTAQARLATMNARRANPAGAVVADDEQAALGRIAAYRGSIPSVAPAGYDVERTSPMPAALPATTAQPMRFGEKLRMFGENAARDVAGVLPQVEARVGTLGKFIERGGYRPEMGRFFNDLLGNPTDPLPAMPTPVRSTETETYKLLPDWLK